MPGWLRRVCRCPGWSSPATRWPTANPLLAAEHLGVEPSRALVVEDSLAGIAAARAGGFPVLGILSTHSPDVLRADVHVPDLSQVTWEVTHDGIRAVVAWGSD